MNSEVKIKLHKELLDVLKKKVKTAAVTIHTEVITEKKTIVVPVTREELVIEKQVFDSKNSNNPTEHSKTIRITIREEHIEVVKHPVVLQDVTIYKRRFQRVESVEKTLKKEIFHLGVIGNVEIVDNKTPPKPRNQN